MKFAWLGFVWLCSALLCFCFAFALRCAALSCLALLLKLLFIRRKMQEAVVTVEAARMEEEVVTAVAEVGFCNS